jgi:hypothetical protein
LLELQRLAGNQAVVAAIGSWRNGRIVMGVEHSDLKLHPSAPPDGLGKMRALKNGQGILGLTIRSIEPSPPLLRPEAPVQTEAGWTCKTRKTRVPEPYFEVYWPTKGRHAVSPGITLDVGADWDAKLKQGEDEHVEDTTLGWQQTWGQVGAKVNELAQAPGPPKPTEAEARRDLWARFAHSLPKDLRPTGAEPSEEAQTAKWGFEPKTTLFRRLFDATVARDTRNWHLPGTTVEFDGKNEIRSLVDGSSKIGEVKSEDLIKEIRAKTAK